MSTLEELHARLQMEENFQTKEHRENRTDPEEALVMRIRNVVRRCFPQNSHVLGNYSRLQGPSSYLLGRSTGFSGQDLVYHRCYKPGHIACNYLALARAHQTPANFGSHSSFSRGTSLNFNSAVPHRGYKAQQFGINILDGSPGEPFSPDLPSKELLEAAFDAINLHDGEDWIVDSGASAHFFGDRTSFSSIDSSHQKSVTSVGGQSHCIEGHGVAEIFLTNGEIKSIHNVQYVPGLYRNILSVGKIANLGHMALFDQSSCFIISKEKPFRVIAKGTRVASTSSPN
jgi:hypothetical protein